MYVVVCRCVSDIACLEKICLLEKIFGLMFKVGKFWCCYQAVSDVEYKLGQQSVLDIICS